MRRHSIIDYSCFLHIGPLEIHRAKEIGFLRFIPAQLGQLSWQCMTTVDSKRQRTHTHLEVSCTFRLGCTGGLNYTVTLYLCPLFF